MPPRPHRRTLTPTEAQRAIYIDFEGNIDKAPTLLGVLYATDACDGVPSRDVLEQWIVEPAFADVVQAGDGASLRVTALETLAVELVRKAKQEKRRIVSWSLHDLTKLVEALGPREGRINALRARHRNAMRTAKRWHRTAHPSQVVEENTLAAYMALVNYDVPAQFGPGRTGASLRTVRAALERGRAWSELTPNQRTRFHNVLMHNQHDLHGMREVVRVAAEALAVPTDIALTGLQADSSRTR